MRRQQRNILPARAQRRQLQADHVQPVEQILAEPSFLHRLGQVDVGRSDDPHIHLDLLRPAQVHEAPVLQDAKNLRLHVRPHRPDLVEEEGAAVGHFEQALLRRNRRSERALDVAEQRRFQQVRRHRARIHWNERLVPPRRIRMQRLRDQFLARPALALDEYGRPARRHLRHQVEQAQHGLALAHDVLEVVALLQRALQLNQFFFRAMPADRRANVGQQLLVVPRLLNEVLRARANRVHHVRHRAVRRNHDHRQVRLHLQNPRQQIDAALARQRQIEQKQVELVACQLLQA